MRFIIYTTSLLFYFVSNATAEPLYDKPMYFSDTDSYYELVLIGNQYPSRFIRDATGWDQVNALALRRTYKGRRGRLAVVPSKGVHDFIKKTFRPELSTWIGLRFYCAYSTGIWVNGRRLRPGDFRAWAKPWNLQSKAYSPTDPRRNNCRVAGPSLPVHYWGIKSGFTWNAGSGTVHWKTFLVEYPPAGKLFE